jgi:hypothetical protein
MEAGGAACSEAGVEDDTLARHWRPNDVRIGRRRSWLHRRLGQLVQGRSTVDMEAEAAAIAWVVSTRAARTESCWWGARPRLRRRRSGTSKTAEMKACRHRHRSDDRRAACSRVLHAATLPPPARRRPPASPHIAVGYRPVPVAQLVGSSLACAVASRQPPRRRSPPFTL